MDARDRFSDDMTIGGASSATSSSGTGVPSPLAPSQAVTSVGGGGAQAARAALNASAILQPGTIIGGRYEIIEMLGLGGMGAVYKAHDRDIDQVVALKVIRPDLAENPELLARFKQELLLARQIAHKNVVRIFDVRDSGGIKFITMEFVAGRDLHNILADRGKLPPAEALDIIQQACAGLAAAHAEGILHRDLKPSNIMRDETGRVVLMDFGLARTVDGGGMTQTGMMLGTMEYMSPEQARAEALDARSDLYAMGLILYEMLTGKMPFKADSALASLLKRTQETAPPISSLDPTLPQSLSLVVSKCLERDRENRYQSVAVLIDQLDFIQGKRPASIYAQPAAVPSHKMWISASVIALVVVAIAVATTAWFLRSRVAPTAHKTVTVLLADFDNSTSDSVFDGTLESSFGLAIEGAPFINAYNRAQARKTVVQVKPGATALDEANARLVALREGISVVISGSVAKNGDGYVITAKAVDAATGKVIGDAEANAKDKSAVLNTLGSLAGKMRGILGDTTPDSAKLALAETFTSSSLEAAHDYSMAQELRYAGKNEEAIQAFLKSIGLDSGFGSAYSGLAAMYANTGDREDAIKYYKLAMEHIDRMTDREKYRTRGAYYLATMNPQKAVEEFSTLVQQYPADIMGHNALAYSYYLNRDMAHALEEGRKSLATYPKNVPYRSNVALYAIYAGDFSAAETEGKAAIEQNPEYLKAYISVALSQIAQGHPEQAEQTYQKLASVKDGASFAANGLADLALYRSDPKQALTVLTKGVADNLAQKKNSAAAKKLTMVAEAQLMMGNASEAVRSLDKAVALDRASVLFSAAHAYVEAGQDNKATPLAEELGKHLEPQPQAYAKLITGEIALRHGKAKDAIADFQDAQKISDSWLGRFDLARAYIAAGAFTEADSELAACIKRRGEATDVYGDEVQTFHYFPATYFYQGREMEGLKSGGAAEAYKTFLALKAADAQDPQVTEARSKAK